MEVFLCISYYLLIIQISINSYSSIWYYQDFAVGAPYDGQGAVYIYHGGPDGAREKPSQIIKAKDVYQGSLSTFGFSIAGGVDLDNNQYNDLIIGAYESDSVFLFR